MQVSADDRIFQLRIDPETERMLDLLATQSERSKSAFVRWLIRQEYSRNYPQPATNGDNHKEPVKEG